MKKLFGVAIAACLFLGVADQAKAAGPIKIDFLPNFCDCLTVYTVGVGGHSYIYGTWDWTCAGAPPYTTIAGTKDGQILATHPTVPFDGGFSAVFDFTGTIPGTGLFDLGATFGGGAGDFTLFQDNMPYTATNAASCPGAPANGLPRLTQ